MKLPKFWQESAQPKILGADARFTQSLRVGKRKEPSLSEICVLFECPILNIGRDLRFELLPELIHAVEFRPLLGQPNEKDVQRLGHGLARERCVTGGLIQHQPDWTAGVRLAQEPQKPLEVLLPHVRSARRYSVASPWVEGAKEHAFGVSARDWDPSLLPTQGPGSAQLRQQPKDGFVLEEPHRVERHAL